MRLTNNISRCLLIKTLFAFLLLVLPVSLVFAEEETSAKAQVNIVPSGQNQRTLDVLDLKNMDINDVLKLISQKSGINIVAGKNVQGKVTTYLRNIDVLEALRIIVESNGWAFEQDKDIIKVMSSAEYETKYGVKFGLETQTKVVQLINVNPKDVEAVLNQIKSTGGKIVPDGKSQSVIIIDTPKKIEEMMMIIKRIDVPIKTEIFKISYASAEEIAGKITEVLTPDVGKIKFDARSNKIAITDTEYKLKDLAEIIKAFDHKEKEVLIEAKILQIVLSDEYKMGIDWEAIVQDYHSLKLSNAFSILSDGEKQGQLSIGTLASDDYEVLIEALDTVGVTDILSSPHITALNNKEAKILVGSTEPYVTSTTTTPSSGPTTTAESVNFIEVGVKLYVTPMIHEDDFITMKIKPEVSSVTDTISTSNNNTIPVVETSEAETTVMVKDGVTIIIGGLIKEEKIKTTKKVPLFGDIPLVGLAFKNVSDSVKKTELVIFLTPHIITGDTKVDIE